MAINYIQGQILASNLDRNGVNLAISNANVGINTLTPRSTFEVAGNLTVGNVVIANIGNINAGNVNINNLATPVANTDAATKYYVDHSTANIGNIGNLVFSNTTVSTSLTNGNITLTATGNGLVTISGVAGFIMPVGNTAQRPSPPASGTLRFNTDINKMEVYTGSAWDQTVGGVTNQTLQGDGTTTAFTLNKSITTAGALVMLNGVVQLPDIAYTVSPSPGTTLTFTEAPVSSDTIDIRFL